MSRSPVRINPRLCLLLCGALLFCSCAQWKTDPESTGRGLPAATLPAAANVLDIVFWPLPQKLPAELAVKFGKDQAASADVLAYLWHHADEMAVPATARQRLYDNGLRACRIDHIRQHVQKLQADDAGDEVERFFGEASIGSDITHSQVRIPFRDGKPQDFAVRQMASQMRNILLRVDDRTIGHSLSQPQFLLSVETHTLPDGRVSVRAWPRIEHGDFRQSFASTERAIRLQSQREKWVLHELAVTTQLDRTQTLVIAPADDAFGIGKEMLTTTLPDGSFEQVVVLIRLTRKSEPALE